MNTTDVVLLADILEVWPGEDDSCDLVTLRGALYTLNQVRYPLDLVEPAYQDRSDWAGELASWLAPYGVPSLPVTVAGLDGPAKVRGVRRAHVEIALRAAQEAAAAPRAHVSAPRAAADTDHSADEALPDDVAWFQPEPVAAVRLNFGNIDQVQVWIESCGIKVWPDNGGLWYQAQGAKMARRSRVTVGSFLVRVPGAKNGFVPRLYAQFVETHRPLQPREDTTTS